MLCELFKQKTAEFLAERDTTGSAHEPQIKVVDYLSREMQAVEDALSVADSNILVVLSRDQIFVSKIIANLHRKHEDYSMMVFGLPVWKHFRNIEAKVLLDLQVHMNSI